jgi:DinB family protein
MKPRDARPPADIRELLDQLEAAEREARALVAGLSEEQGTWRREPGSWSISECFDHLATANCVYLAAMEEPAEWARRDGRPRRGPATAGWVARLFVRSLEPPPRWWSRRRAPRKIRPRPAPPLGPTFAGLVASQADVHAFLRAHADLDLAGIRFPNPLVRGIRFSLATGLHVIAAHERRHLWQAWNVRRVLGRNEQGAGGGRG